MTKKIFNVRSPLYRHSGESSLTSLEDTLKIIGMAAIGILGIVIVLIILSALCGLVAIFAYVSIPGTPTVTISPIDFPINFSDISQATAVIAGQADFVLYAAA